MLISHTLYRDLHYRYSVPLIVDYFIYPVICSIPMYFCTVIFELLRNNNLYYYPSYLIKIYSTQCTHIESRDISCKGVLGVNSSTQTFSLERIFLTWPCKVNLLANLGIFFYLWIYIINNLWTYLCMYYFRRRKKRWDIIFCVNKRRERWILE